MKYIREYKIKPIKGDTRSLDPKPPTLYYGLLRGILGVKTLNPLIWLVKGDTRNLDYGSCWEPPSGSQATSEACSSVGRHL